MVNKKLEVCRECTKKCLSIHGKRDTLPVILSFFKVLVGDRFSEVLFIPPKFARMITCVLGKETYLEDSNGQRWRVKLATINGSLAFHQGWDKFASDHILEAGQFLIFTYICGSHFVVQVYDKSGCEKLKFSQKENNCSQKKAAPELSSDHLPSDGRKSVPTEAHSLIMDEGFMKEQDSSSTVLVAPNIGIINSDVKDAEKIVMAAKSTSVRDIYRERPQSQPTAYCTEVPYYIIDREVATGQEETRTSLFDLSNFEIFRDQTEADRRENVSATVGKETSSHHNGISVRPQGSVGEGTIDKNLVAVEGACGRASFDVCDLKMTEMDCSAGDLDKVPHNIKKDSCGNCNSLRLRIPPSRKPDEKEKANPDMSNIAFGLAVRQNFNDLGNKSLVKSGMKETPLFGSSGKGLNVVKKEHEEMIKQANGMASKTIKDKFEEKVNPSSKDKGKSYKAVKTELMDSDDFSSPDLINFCYSVTVVTQSWLELSTASVSRKRKSKKERQIVLLRDPAMRVWAVFYNEQPGFRILTSGWEAFAKANNIQPGDVCFFGVENHSEGVLRVNIVRRPMLSQVTHKFVL